MLRNKMINLASVHFLAQRPRTRAAMAGYAESITELARTQGGDESHFALVTDQPGIEKHVRAQADTASGISRFSARTAVQLGGSNVHVLDEIAIGQAGLSAQTLTRRVLSMDGQSLTTTHKVVVEGEERHELIMARSQERAPSPTHEREEWLQETAAALLKALSLASEIIARSDLGVHEEAGRYRRLKLSSAYAIFIAPNADGSFTLHQGHETLIFFLNAQAPQMGIPDVLFSIIEESDYLLISIPLLEETDQPSNTDDLAQITLEFRGGLLTEMTLSETRRAASGKEFSGPVAERILAVQAQFEALDVYLGAATPPAETNVGSAIRALLGTALKP